MINVNKYIKIPFKSHGRDFDGCDCYGLVRLVLKEEYGINIPDFWDYSHANDIKAVADLIMNNKAIVASKKKEYPDEGDIVVFRHSGAVCHVGIFVGEGLVLHMLNSANANCNKLKAVEKLYKVEGFYEV